MRALRGGLARPGFGLPAFFCALFVLAMPLAARAQNLVPRGAASERPTAPWLAEGRRLASSGDWASVADLMSQARIVDPSDSDIRHLWALALLENSAPLGQVIAQLDTALSASNFAYYGEYETRLFKAELLIRLRRHAEALLVLEPPASDAVLRPSYRWVRARAFYGLGRTEAYEEELAEALRRFPDDIRFPELFLRHMGRAPASRKARALADIILGRLELYAVAAPELRLKTLPLILDAARRRDLVLAFRAAGGASALATIHALEYGLISGAAASSEFFSGAYPLCTEDMETLRSLLRDETERETFAQALASWSGRIEADRDRDGVIEEFCQIDRGQIVAWNLDSDQDSSFDLMVDFYQGLPSEARLRSPSLVFSGDPAADGLWVSGIEGFGKEAAPEEAWLDIRYADYPGLASLNLNLGQKTLSYEFGPESLAWAPLRMRALAGRGRFAVFLPEPTHEPVPTGRSIAAQALFCSIIDREEGAREVFSLERGVPIRAEKHIAGRAYSSSEYRKGKLLRQKLDRDGDGRFETEKLYEQGPEGQARLAWVRVDADGDGLYEYAEEPDFPFRKEWDLDADGSMDVRQRELPGGDILREYSSRLDGRFDETLRIREGRLIALERDGQKPALIPDKAPGLMWIGVKPFDLGPNLPASEGVYMRMGKRFRIIKAGGQTFAELVP